MSSPVVLLTVSAIPVAVVRRFVKSFELSRAVPECCGLAWKAVRAQNVKAGRNVAIYWDGSIRLEAGVELQGPFQRKVRSSVPPPQAVLRHPPRILGPMVVLALRTLRFK